MTTLRLDLQQMSASPDVDENLATITAGIADAAAVGADLVVFPEAAMACFGSPLEELAQPLDGPFASAIRAAAAQHGVVAVVGMFTPSIDGRTHNTLLATGPGVEASYNKIHLYDAFGAYESATIAPGEELVTFEVAGTTVGLSTCYDLRFADQFTALGKAGASVIVVPASWGDGPGKAEQWDVLTRARAMDAQAWLAACDQAWTPPQGSDPLGVGRSCVVGPLGQVRGRLDHQVGRLIVDVDPEEVEVVRQRVPIL